jgi:AGZA family xanthine/uracil permease-like MFS transporter
MAYIVVLNPIILSGAKDVNGKSLSFAAVTTSTALVAAVMTVLMGVVGRYPFALAAGLGLNGVVAFQLAGQMSWPAAMGVVVLEGLVILLLVVTGLRERVLDAIPLALKTSISVGIGLFIAFIGFVDAGFVRRTATGPVPVEIGLGGRLQGWPVVVFAVGLLLTSVLVARRVRGGILLSIIGTTIFAIILNAIVDVPASAGGKNPEGWGLNVPKLPDKIVGSPDFSLLGDFSITGSFVKVGIVSAVLLVFTTSSTRWARSSGSATRAVCSTRTGGSRESAGCCSSTPSRRRPAARRRPRRTRPTSSRRRASARARAPAWPPSSPAGSSSSRSS